MSKLNKIDVICPLYNAENDLENIHGFVSMQKNMNIENIFYILTRSTDNTEEKLSKLQKEDSRIKVDVIEKENFSHSLTRERIAMKSKSDILIFITQDIVIKDENCFANLVKPIIEQEAEATYARQIAKHNNIEKYTREFNYPEESYIKTKADVPNMGLKTFFFSDACAAIKTNIFQELNGYDGKDMPINEDMYFSYKLIMNGYRIRYTAEAVIYHSHKLSIIKLYRRYKQSGKFFKQNEFLDNYGTIKSGSSMAIYIFKRIIQEHKFYLLLIYPFDMIARIVGMKVGKL